MNPRRGFTLIEIMAVVLLIGLLAAAAAWSLASDAQQATRNDVIGRLTGADASARVTARRLGPSTLHFDLDEQRLWLETPAAGTESPRAGHWIQVPPPYRIDEITWLDPEPVEARKAKPRKRITENARRVEMPISSAGLSRTYAIKLVGPGKDPETGKIDGNTTSATWLLFSGLSGQVTIEHEPEPIDSLFETLARTRPDPD